LISVWCCSRASFRCRWVAITHWVTVRYGVPRTTRGGSDD
jgi:hypothetical protein